MLGNRLKKFKYCMRCSLSSDCKEKVEKMLYFMNKWGTRDEQRPKELSLCNKLRFLNPISLQPNAIDLMTSVLSNNLNLKY